MGKGEPTSWAGAAKLSWEQVDRLRNRGPMKRGEIVVLAAEWGVHADTLRRARRGASWARPFRQRLPQESKSCVICGATFQRISPAGRRRSPDHWARKRTCGPVCALAWAKRALAGLKASGLLRRGR